MRRKQFTERNRKLSCSQPVAAGPKEQRRPTPPGKLRCVGAQRKCPGEQEDGGKRSIALYNERVSFDEYGKEDKSAVSLCTWRPPWGENLKCAARGPHAVSGYGVQSRLIHSANKAKWKSASRLARLIVLEVINPIPAEEGELV
ncbi:hypothetical protein MRX96_031030 [Rhipicephalus microplus]